jgi:hypothetical protein
MPAEHLEGESYSRSGGKLNVELASSGSPVEEQQFDFSILLLQSAPFPIPSLLYAIQSHGVEDDATQGILIGKLPADDLPVESCRTAALIRDR